MRAFVLTVVAGLVGLVGCFNPHYAEGGFACGVSEPCPEAQICSPIDNHCHSRDHLPTVPDGGSDAVAEAGSRDALPPVVRGLGESCDPTNGGTPFRTDNCAAGLVCIDGTHGSKCFRRCQSSAECGNVACEARLIETGGNTAFVCGLQPTTCDPVSLSGCATGICYLTGAATTVCDTTSGEGFRNACTYSRDCLPGWTCATVGPGAGYCQAVCSTASPKCPVGNVCQPSSQTYSYCY